VRITVLPNLSNLSNLTLYMKSL